MMPSSRPSPVFGPLAAALLACSHTAGSQELAAPQVTVTGSVVQRRVEESPYAIAVVDREALREAGPMINLSEAMSRVPGLVVNLRNNYAQDLQISSRGFGARAGFGVRGIRLYTDGIPATGPDGQGQISHADLAGAQRVEVLRGPFSVLYGNSSGGVIAVFGAAATRAEAEIGLDAGSFGLGQLRGQIALPLGGGFDLRGSLAAMEVEGFRRHSSAERRSGQARLGWQGESDRVTLIANALDQPAEDPLGLSRAQFDADPRQTAPQAIDFNTRKTVRQDQLGFSWRHGFAEGALREGVLAVYAGQRMVATWQAIPPTAQASPRHGGGVVDFSRDYGGVDARLRWAWTGVDVVAGVSLDDQRDDRQGYENFTGPASAPTALGVTGALRRDEVNRARARDAYVQGELELRPGLAASAGLRAGQVRLSTRDAFLANGVDSGAMDFRYANPVAGLRWTAWRQGADSLNLHASAARGSESPTLGELAYRPDGAGGFNDALRAQGSRQFEVGAKWRSGWLGLDATLFDVKVDHEIATLTNAGGRSSFQNVGRTRRQGAELSVRWQPAAPWSALVAATWLDARYLDSFLACAGVPCLQPTLVVPAGNRIAGTQRVSGYAELAWQDARWGRWALEARGAGRAAVNDSNSDFAEGYGVAALRWSKRYAFGAGRQLELLLRVDNLLDKAYAGSVIVNDGNGRFFETGAPRSALVGVRWLGDL